MASLSSSSAKRCRIMTFAEARTKLADPLSGLERRTVQTHLSLSPKYIGSITIGVKEQLDATLEIYSEELDGVPLAYSKAQVLQSHGTIIDDHPHIHFDVRVEYVVFRPVIASRLRGVIASFNATSVVCVVHNYYSAYLSTSKHKSRGEKRAKMAVGRGAVFEVLSVDMRSNAMTGKLVEMEECSDASVSS